MPRRTLSLLPLLLFLSVGCLKPQGSSSEEDAARKTVTDLQAALKARNADAMWDLLDADSRADADRVATGVREGYARADATVRKQREVSLGLDGAELADLSGRGYLKTNYFLGHYDELAQGKVGSASVKGDTATVSYTEPDNDIETVQLVKADGKWKVKLAIPAVNIDPPPPPGTGFKKKQ